MKRSFIGYNPKEVDETVAKLNEHNELLTRRLERQDEEIKELRARYAGFATVEARLKAAVETMSENLDTLDGSIEEVESFGEVQEMFSSMTTLSSDLVDATDESHKAIIDGQSACEYAKNIVDNSYEKSVRLQDKLLDVAATSKAICWLLETFDAKSDSISIKTLLPYLQTIQNDSLAAAKEDISFNIGQALDCLDVSKVAQAEQTIAKVGKDASRLQASSSLVCEKLEGRSASVEDVKAEVNELQRSLATVLNVAAYTGKLSNDGLADIERSKVRSILGQDASPSEEEVHVEITDPSGLIDNTRPPAIIELEVESSEDAADMSASLEAVDSKASER